MKFATEARIALRHLSSRPFQTFSVISLITFSTALAVTLFLMTHGLREGLVKAVEPFDLIIGAKGSPYQLVLNTVFLQDTPAGNIEWDDYLAVSADERVDFAVPLAFGDNYMGYPVVGSTRNILNMRSGVSTPWLRVSEGEFFKAPFEAVLGSNAAVSLGLRMGDRFRTSHGIIADAGEEHESIYTVSGIAESSGGPYDRAIFVNIGDIWTEHGGHQHERRARVDIKREGGAVTAILAHPKSYRDAYSLAVSFQHDARCQLVFPAQAIIRLFSIMGRGERFLSVIIYSVAACSLMTAFLALFWSGAARRRERAMLRIIGASRKSLAVILWLEGAFILLAGAFWGELAGRAGAHAVFSLLSDATAIDPSIPFTLQETAAPIILLVTGALGGAASALREWRAEGDEFQWRR